MVKRLRHRPFTAVTRVRFPSESVVKVCRLIAVQLKETEYADVAQLAEQLICNQQVNGSSPFIGFCQQGNNPASVHGPLAQLVRATGS